MSKLKEVLITIFILVLFAAFAVGLIWLLWWDYNNDTAAYVKQCQEIAELADVKEYKAGYGECFILKDGKIVEVQL